MRQRCWFPSRCNTERHFPPYERRCPSWLMANQPVPWAKPSRWRSRGDEEGWVIQLRAGQVPNFGEVDPLPDAAHLCRLRLIRLATSNQESGGAWNDRCQDYD